MARWLRITDLGRGAVTTTWLASAGGFLRTVTCLLALAAVVTASCAAHFLFHSRNGETRGTTSIRSSSPADPSARGFKLKISGRALINSSKRLLLSMKLRRREEVKVNRYDRAATTKEEGRGGLLWQRSILMGERCQPPDFSGVIIYDDKGNRLPEFPPRSPRRNIFHPSLDQADALEQR